MSAPVTTSPDSRKAGQLSPLLRVALLLGVLAHLVGFLVFRIASDPLPDRQQDSAFIALVSSGSDSGSSDLIEQASLFDSAPLFVPGEWSAAAQVFSDRIVADWRVFPDFEPGIELLDALRPAGLSLAGVVPVKQPEDLLDLRFWDLLSHFGQKKLKALAFEGATSLAQVTVIGGGGTGSKERSIRFAVDALPVEAAIGPLVLYVNMSAPGLPIGAPLVQESSGSEVWDRQVLAWLRRPATLAQLPAGYLQVRVFPE